MGKALEIKTVAGRRVDLKTIIDRRGHVAVHEAAHVAASWRRQCRFEYVSITREKNEFDGLVMGFPVPEHVEHAHLNRSPLDKWADDEIFIRMSGPIAEAKWLEVPLGVPFSFMKCAPNRASSFLDEIYEYERGDFVFNGAEGDRQGVAAVVEMKHQHEHYGKQDIQVSYINYMFEQVNKFIQAKPYWSMIIAFANVLLERETLGYDEAMKLFLRSRSRPKSGHSTHKVGEKTTYQVFP